MSKDIETIANRLYDTFNRRDWKALSEMTSSTCTIKDMATGTELKGVDGMMQWMKQWATLCSDMKANVHVIASTDKQVVIEGVGNGRNDGPIESPQGKLPASNKPLKVEWVDVLEFKDGKVNGIRCYYDMMQIMTQLGIAPQPGQPGKPPSQYGVQH